MANLPLTDTERWDLINALQIAAERYREHVKSLREIKTDNLHALGAKRLSEQFERQAADVEKLIETLTDLED